MGGKTTPKMHHDWYMKNRERLLLKSKVYREQHPDMMKEARKKYAKTHPEMVKKHIRLWKERHQEHIKKYYQSERVKVMVRISRKNRIKNDETFRFHINIGKRIHFALHKYRLVMKERPLKKYVDFSIKQLIEKFTIEFDANMNWENYGSYWELGHKIPVSWLKGEQELREIGWNINNLFPVEKNYNRNIQINRFAVINGKEIYNRQEAIRLFKEKYLVLKNEEIGLNEEIIRINKI